MDPFLSRPSMPSSRRSYSLFLFSPFYHALSQALPVSNVSISIFSSVQRTLPALRRCARPVSIVITIVVVVVGMVVVLVVPPLRPSRARAF